MKPEKNKIDSKPKPLVKNIKNGLQNQNRKCYFQKRTFEKKKNRKNKMLFITKKM